MLKNGFRCRSLIYALFLLWLALTGSFEAYQQPILLAINGYLASIILFWGGWQIGRSGLKPLTWPFAGYYLVMLIATLVNGREGMELGIIRLYYICILFAAYHLPVNIGALQRGAYWAGWPVFILGTLFPWENGNSMAFAFWALYWLGLPAAGRPATFSALAMVAMLASGSEGGMLAVAAGGAFYLWHRWGRGIKWLGPALVTGLVGLVTGVVASKVHDMGSFGNRVIVYQTAWQGFLNFPWLGNGADSFRVITPSRKLVMSPHNLILSVLWETGLAGLAMIGWFVLRLFRHIELPAWSLAWLITFICHSMVDSPLINSFIVAICLMFILGGLPCKEKITWPWRWSSPWAWRFSPPPRT